MGAGRFEADGSTFKYTLWNWGWGAYFSFYRGCCQMGERKIRDRLRKQHLGETLLERHPTFSINCPLFSENEITYVKEPGVKF